MPKNFDSVASDSDFAPSLARSSEVSGTVLKPFNGPTRRFAVDYVVLDTDVPDLPMSLDDLRGGGFVA